MPHPNVRYPIEDRFWLWVDKNGPTPEQHPHLGVCWLWTGGLDPDGYGKFKDGGSVRAARWIYQRLVGEIPAGFVIDHLCRLRACVRPTHLEPVTNMINIMRGEGLAPRNVMKTMCPKGHPYAGDNLLMQGRRRHCLLCRRTNDAQRHRDKRRAQAAKRKSDASREDA